MMAVSCLILDHHREKMRGKAIRFMINQSDNQFPLPGMGK